MKAIAQICPCKIYVIALGLIKRKKKFREIFFEKKSYVRSDFRPNIAKNGVCALKNSFPENESIFLYSVKSGDMPIPKGFDSKH